MKPRLQSPATGYLAAALGMATVTAVCCALRTHVNEMTVALAMLLVVLFVAGVWEIGPALLASVLGMLCLNYFFLPPIYTFTIEDPKNWFALTAFFITALTAGKLSTWAKQRAAEAEAGRSQARLASAYNRSLLEATLDPLMTVGGDGRINDVNAAAETVTGRRRLELIGCEFDELFTEAAKAREARDRVFRDGLVRGYPLDLLHRGGHTTSVLVDASLYRDAFGTVIGVAVVLHPIGTFAVNPSENRPEPMVVRHLNLLVRFAAALSMAVGIVSILGLELGIARIKRITPEGPVIKMNAAVCLVLLGLSLWLERRADKRLVGRILAGATALVGFLTLTEHLFGWNLGIDQLLYREPYADALTGTRPGLISLITAADFFLLGLALIFLDHGVSWKSQRYRPAQYLASLSAILATLGVLDFLLGAHASYTYIALQTAVTLLFVSLGVLCARIDLGVAALLGSSTAGGALVRRLIPGAVIIPILIGAVSLQALSSHLTSEWGAVSLMIVTMIVMLSAFSVWNGHIVNRGDIERERTEAILERRQVELSEAERLAQMGSWWRDVKAVTVVWSAGLSHIALRDPMLPPPSWKEHLGFFTPESASRLDAAVTKALTTGAPFQTELEMLRSDGAVRQVVARGEVEHDDQAQIVLVRSTVQDITDRKQAELALQRSAEEISDLYNRAPCGYHSLDKDGIFVRINDTELEWIQYTREELIGKRHFSDVITPEGFKIFTGHFQQFQVTGQARDLEYTMVRKDGTTFPVLISGTAVKDAAGNYLMSRSTVYDISARKREEQARAQLAAIVESSDDAIVSENLDERILTWNKGAEKIFGYTAEEMVGGPVAKIVPPARAGELHKVMQSLIHGESAGHVETVRIRKDGQSIDVALTISPIRDKEGQITSFAAVSRDITERKRAENEIRHLARRQAVVAELGQQMLRNDPVETILDQSVADVADTLGVEFCNVLELLPDRKEMLLKSGVGWQSGLVGRAKVSTGLDSQAGFTLLSKDPVVVEDLRNETRFSGPPLLHHHGVVSGMSVIIPTSAGPWGVMGAHTRQQRSFTPDEVNFLQSVANLLGNMIERRRAEDEILRINRAQRALSSCNEALVRATDESKLPQDICRIIADQAGYRFCWVGHAENDAPKSVKPLAWAGYDEGYLKTVNVTWADTERGRGPTGTCIRTLQTQIARNYADPSLAPWREEALKRGYASSVAVPIVVDSEVFGALTIYSRTPEAFGAEEVSLLSELAADLGFGIGTIRNREELRKLNSELEQRVISRTAELHAANKQLEQAREREIEIGFRIQQTLLLDQPPVDVPGLRVAALTIPSQRIDGDFYIFIRHSDDCLDLIVGDVMGKGIPAALLGAATKSHFLKALGDLMGQCKKGELPEPREIVMLAHAELVGHLIELDSFVTLVYARFDGKNRRLDLVDCGHTGTIHLHGSTGRCELLHGDNLPLGVREGEIYDQISVPYEPGDVLVFFSDGITEARNSEGQLFGDKRLEDCVVANAVLAPATLVEAIRKAVFTFSGSNKLVDDLTTVAVRVEERQRPIAQAEIEIASDLKNLRRAREFVREFCSDILDNDSAAELDLAVNEALSNIMKHAYHGRADQWIHMEAEAFPGRVAIRLHHLGDPFKPATAPPPSLDGSRESGFGAYIISRSVDEVRYYRDERGRNCIALIKVRK